MTDETPDLLKGLSPEDARETLALGSRINLESGQELFHLGEPAGCLYLILRGRVKLTLPMQVRGRQEDILVEERGHGETIGWSGLIPPFHFTLTASALIATEVVAWPREALQDHFLAHPDVGHAVSLNLATVIGQRLQLFQAMWLREMQRTVEMHRL